MINTNRDTVQQKKVEEYVAWMIEYNKGRRVITLPEYSAADYIISKMENGIATATSIAEFRHRPQCSFNKHPDIVVNVAKVDKIRKAAEYLDMMPILLVLWKEPVLMWAHLGRQFEIDNNFQRNKQERPNDRPEPVYKIPTRSFSPYMDVWVEGV